MLRLCLLAAMLSGSGASALAQDASTRGGEEISQSRISPVQPGVVRPPMPIAPPTVSAEPDTRSLEEQLGNPVSPAEFVEDTRLCLAVVAPDHTVRSDILADGGWAYTQPSPKSNELGSYEFIQFFKDYRSIALLDFGSRVLCRAAGRVEGVSQLGEVRRSLIDTLAAAPIDEAPKMAEFVANIRRSDPKADLSNTLISGNYLLELAAGEMSLGELATPSRPSISMVMITSVPLPKEFQSHAPTGATN